LRSVLPTIWYIYIINRNRRQNPEPPHRSPGPLCGGGLCGRHGGVSMSPRDPKGVHQTEPRREAADQRASERANARRGAQRPIFFSAKGKSEAKRTEREKRAKRTKSEAKRTKTERSEANRKSEAKRSEAKTFSLLYIIKTNSRDYK